MTGGRVPFTSLDVDFHLLLRVFQIYAFYIFLLLFCFPVKFVSFYFSLFLYFFIFFFYISYHCVSLQSLFLSIFFIFLFIYIFPSLCFPAKFISFYFFNFFVYFLFSIIVFPGKVLFTSQDVYFYFNLRVL